MKHKWIVYLVSFAVFLGPFTQTIYTPLLPEVQRSFQTTSFMVNMSISIFTFFLAMMQIVYGPLIDSKGRRKVLLIGLVVYIIASIGCSLSQSIALLLVFRALQAIGIAAGSIVAVTVIGDLFEGPERGRAMGIFQMMVFLGPVLGPVIGGFLGGFADLACGFRWNSDVRKHYESQIRQAKLERKKHKAGNSRKRAETTFSNHSNTEILGTVSQVTEQKNFSSQYLDQIINLAQNQKLHLANMAKQIKRLNEQLSEKESEVEQIKRELDEAKALTINEDLSDTASNFEKGKAYWSDR